MGKYSDADVAHAELFRWRFAGRPDAYGIKWYGTDADGKQKAGYTPMCENRWEDFCHLKIKDGTPCSDCVNKKYVPVTNESVLKHIKGDEEHMFYNLFEDGTIRFGAIDLDYKEGKEDKGYTWEEIMPLHHQLKEWGIPHGVARSTSRGHHIYIFFDEPCKAYIFRSFIKGLLVRTQITRNASKGKKEQPEIFPKQDYYDKGGFGNGIKPPMIEPGFQKSKNCFIDENNHVVTDQWEYLEKLASSTEGQLLKVMEENGIEVTGKEKPVARTRSGRIQTVKSGYDQPIKGYVEPVLQGCAAFNRLWEKTKNGEVLGHREGFSLFHMCMHTVDGKDWFYGGNVPGWAETDAHKRQLEASVDKAYAPHTCRTMQDDGICEEGTKCFNKKPPLVKIKGRLVPDPDVPNEEDWPDPSPIRYATHPGEDYLDKLKAEIEALDKKEEESKLVDLVEVIVKRALVFDRARVKEFKDFIKKKRLLKAMHINRMFSKAEEKFAEEVKEKATKRDDVFCVDGITYIKVKPHGLAVLKVKKEGVSEVQLCSFDILLDKEVTIYGDDEDNEEPSKVYFGRFKCVGFEKGFRIEMTKWADNTKLYEFFSELAGAYFNLMKSNVDHLRHGVLGLAAYNQIKRNNCLMAQGWHGGTYVMPSIIVDQEGVRPNDSHPIDIQGRKSYSKYLDFAYAEDHEIKELLYHIKDEMLNAWPRLWTMTGLAHTLYPAVRRKLNMVEKPTLFFEGDSGCGKTQLTRAFQHFWGNFDSLIGLLSTEKGIMSLCHEFKDALLVVDDYKGINIQQRQAVTKIIQYSYNPVGTVKLRRDSSMAATKLPKGVLMISGEQFIANEISLLGRTIMIETRTFNTKKTEKYYQAVNDHIKDYSKVLPRFLHWYIEQSDTVVRDRLKELKKEMYEPFAGGPNSDRIAVNMSVNYLCWELFTEYLEYAGVIDSEEKSDLRKEHWENVQYLMGRMVTLGGEAHHGTVFREALTEAIQSGQVSIQGIKEYENENKPCIGFVKQGLEYEVYLYPGIVFQCVQKLFDKEPMNVTKRALARQLEDMGFFVRTDSNRHTSVCRVGNRTTRCWVVRPEKLGIITEEEPPRKVVNAPKEPASATVGKDADIIPFPDI